MNPAVFWARESQEPAGKSGFAPVSPASRLAGLPFLAQPKENKMRKR